MFYLISGGGNTDSLNLKQIIPAQFRTIMYWCYFFVSLFFILSARSEIGPAIMSEHGDYFETFVVLIK